MSNLANGSSIYDYNSDMIIFWDEVWFEIVETIQISFMLRSDHIWILDYMGRYTIDPKPDYIPNISISI